MVRWLAPLQTSASALTAERLRMDVIANNIANANTTRTNAGGPFRRQMVVLGTREPFPAQLARALKAEGGSEPVKSAVGQGVRVLGIAGDPRPFKLKYDPSHPDADEQGYLHLPNVEILTEMVDLISATRAYEANVTVLGAFKAMASTALQIGR